MRPSRVSATVLLAVLVASWGVAAPPPAAAGVTAGSAQKVGSMLVFTAYPGVANRVTLWPGGLTDLEIVDTAGDVDLLDGTCVPSSAPVKPPRVVCDLTGVTLVKVDGGDGDDAMAVRDPMAVLMLGGPGNDNLSGGAGDDQLDGGSGDDILFGGDGDDVLVGGPGADQLDGGLGSDLADYSQVSIGLVVDADGQYRDDGTPGEGDSVGADVERLTGGAGPDVLGGNGLANVLVGNGGADTLTGGAGPDTLLGGAGYDHLDGGTGPVGPPEQDVCGPGPGGAQLLRCEVVVQ